MQVQSLGREDPLDGSLCCPRDSQESSPIPQFLEIDWLQILSCGGKGGPWKD